MNIHIITIFPEIYESFLSASLISKSVKNKKLQFFLHNPRDLCSDKHKQIDDTIYGGGAGMLLKAKPFIDMIDQIISKISGTYKIIFLAPSKTIFDQKKAQSLKDIDNLVVVCGRYEGIDARFEMYMEKKYKTNFSKISIGKYVLMGGEVASMVLIEGVVRLIPGVIKEMSSHEDESYNISKNMKNIEYPQFTRPDDVYGMRVPQVLLSGHQKNIEKRKKDNEKISGKIGQKKKNG